MEYSSRPKPGDILYDPNAAAILQPFLRLNFATVWVRDQERSLRFFVDQLGFHALVDVEATGHGRWIVVSPPAGLPGIALVTPAEGSAESKRIGHHTGLSFLTEDVHAVFEAWSNNGVRFPLPPMEPAWGSGQARHAQFEDVDGNTYSVIEFDEATRTLEAERRAHAARVEAERQAAHDLAIAKEVQTRLFPQQQPFLRTLEYAGLCYPARVVGGDYYDFLELGTGRLGLVIADIVGKGMGAALLMANLQANLRSRSATAWGQTERFLRSVNQSFYENTASRDYATIFFAEYDDHTRQLRYANCGHPPVFLLRGKQSIERLEPTSMVLGLFGEWECGVEERQLCPGDTLVLYTDGATESFNDAGEEFGEERLLESLRKHSQLAPAALLAAVADEITKFSPDQQADDITLIAARCR